MKKILGIAVLSIAVLSFAAGCGKGKEVDTSTKEKKVEISSESSTEGTKANTGVKEEKKAEDNKADDNKGVEPKQEEPKKETEDNKKNEVSNSDNAEIIEIGVYASDDQAMGVTRFTKSVKVYDKRVAFAALQALKSNDWPNGYVSAIPESVSFNGVSINNGLAVVKYTNSGGSLGSAGISVFVDSVVNTLTEFPTINSVKFEVDGVSIMQGHIEDGYIFTRQSN